MKKLLLVLIAGLTVSAAQVQASQFEVITRTATTGICQFAQQHPTITACATAALVGGLMVCANDVSDKACEGMEWVFEKLQNSFCYVRTSPRLKMFIGATASSLATAFVLQNVAAK